MAFSRRRFAVFASVVSLSSLFVACGSARDELGAAGADAASAPATPADADASLGDLDAGSAHDATKASDASDGGLDASKTDDASGDGGGVVPGASARTLGLGVYHTCAILSNGSTKCWGWNEAGRLGLEDKTDRGGLAGQMGAALPVVNLGTSRSAVSLSTGLAHTCAILDNGALKCFGSNVYGQLGLGVPTIYGDAAGEMGDALPNVDLGVGRSAKTIAVGDAHSCAILDNGKVKCWGRNEYGELGLGDTQNRGDAAGEMGDALPYVDLGTGRTAKAITAGRHHVCAILDDNRLKCWGRNLGQLGLGDVQNRGDAPGQMGDALPAVDLGAGRHAVVVAGGENHTCAILDDARVKCWGTNFYGELGLEDSVYRGNNPGEMGNALPTVKLGTGRTAKALALGGSHTCVVLDDDSLKCWGSNTLGELGRGSQGDYGNQPGQLGDALAPIDLGTGRKVKELASGNSHLCARLDDLTLKCWGWNAFGQLGLGNTNARGDFPGEMGNALPVVATGP